MLKKFYILFGGTAICTFLCISILFLILTSICGIDICLMNRHSTKPMASVLCLSTLSLFSFIICLGSQLCCIYSLEVDYQIPDHQLYQQIIFGVNILSWTLGQLFLYLLFITNLHHTFKNTLIKVSKSLIIFLTALVIAFFICRLMFIALYLVYYDNILNDKQFSFPAAILVSSTEFLDLILSIILVYFFVNRLFKLFVFSRNQFKRKQNNKHKQIKANTNANASSTKQSLIIQETTTSHSLSSTILSKTVTVTTDSNSERFYLEDTATSTLNSKQYSIIFVASKYAILSTIAIISTQLFLVSAVNNAIAISASDMYYYCGYTIYAILLAIDCLINSVCICLNLEANQVWFVCMCCCCEDCCHSMCICISKRWYSKKK